VFGQQRVVFRVVALELNGFFQRPGGVRAILSVGCAKAYGGVNACGEEGNGGDTSDPLDQCTQ